MLICEFAHSLFSNCVRSRTKNEVDHLLPFWLSHFLPPSSLCLLLLPFPTFDPFLATWARSWNDRDYFSSYCLQNLFSVVLWISSIHIVELWSKGGAGSIPGNLAHHKPGNSSRLHCALSSISDPNPPRFSDCTMFTLFLLCECVHMFRQFQGGLGARHFFTRYTTKERPRHSHRETTARTHTITQSPPQLSSCRPCPTKIKVYELLPMLRNVILRNLK